jgi:hypothetical protein
MKNFTQLFIGLFSIMFIFASCSDKHKKTNHIITSDTLLSKTIQFPGSLFILNRPNLQNIDSFILKTKGKTKIISIVDGTCMDCIINNLNKTDSIFNSIFLNENDMMIFILNVSKRDSVFFARNLLPAIDADGIILWDNNYNFERQNKLFSSSMNLRTFMLNDKNQIIQYGNPILNPSVIIEYKEKLQRLKK